MPSCQVICADVLTWAREYKQRIERGEAKPFHALLCDPPWEYAFMNRKWDNTGITFQPETWATLAEVLHPGAFLMVFAGSRGWHRLACAMEDAGLILQPSIFIWLNSQSFPKASRLRKAPKSERARRYRWLGWLGRLGNWLLRKKGKPPKHYLDYVWEGHRYGGQVLKDAATPIIVAQKPWTNPRLDCIVETGAGAINVDAGRINSAVLDSERRTSVPAPGIWGHGKKHPQKEGEQRHNPQGRWPSNFALVHKAPGPDGEGGCVRAGTRRVKKQDGGTRRTGGNGYEGGWGDARPPHSGYADPDGMETVDAWRCEEGCVCEKLGEMSGESGNNWRASKGPKSKLLSYDGGFKRPLSTGHNDKGTAARYYHQAGWEHERAECAEGCPVAKLDEQAGERKTTYISPHHQNRRDGEFLGQLGHPQQQGYDDSGGASRFYAQADWTAEIAERLATEDPVRYCPKAAKRERNEGLDDFFWRKDKQSPTGFVRIGKDEWEALGEEEQRVKAEMGKRVSLRAQGNIHVAVKPIGLCKWLASLLLPPKEYAPRRIVIPFCGTFREGVGAILAGWEEVVGIDFIQDYCDIAESGIKFWHAKSRLETAQMEMTI